MIRAIMSEYLVRTRLTDRIRKQNTTDWLLRQKKEDQQESATIEREKLEQIQEQEPEEQPEESKRKGDVPAS
jgi:hypothetical protein